MNCPNCQSSLNEYPGGISKRTGKPYSARQQCSNPECDYVKWEPKEKVGRKVDAKKEAASEIIFELQAIREILERIDGTMTEKAIQKKYSSQDGLQKAVEKENVEQHGEPPEEWLNQ